MAPKRTLAELMPVVDDQLLADITRKIVDRFHPEEVILFGSRAWGMPHPESDVDILVIMESDKGWVDRAVDVDVACKPKFLPMDILVKTPAEMEESVDDGDPFIEEILTRGRVLYARSPNGGTVGALRRRLLEAPPRPPQRTLADMMPVVDDQLLADITRKIVESFHPEKVILFGARAWGYPRPESNVNLLVIMESDKEWPDRSVEVSTACRPRFLPLYVMVETPAEIRERLESGDSFIEEILSRGRVLYGR
ncbi:MAG: nucleotidyltransferase domain-containing protein [Candidatus Sumerlaeota bacterium]|nr:nucleotidyltransferase domain-containing protein [Candidatus Sumerlaeota bacterium]